MKTHDFWYDLPQELIAQTPLEKRDNSRLMVMTFILQFLDFFSEGREVFLSEFDVQRSLRFCP